MGKEHAMSDAEMIIAAQIAYMDAGGSSTPNVTVGELIDNARSKYGVYDSESGTWVPRTDIPLSEKQKSQLRTANEVEALMNKHDAEYARNWVIVDQCDKNNESGMYACLIDTRDGNAIVGYRGSESFDTNQYIKDWGAADLGLLNNSLTEQQKDAEEYIRYINERYGDDYNPFSLTGHSLGGNLAQHAGNMAPDEMRGKIDHAISFDGPGFSDEYIKSHYLEIQKAKDYQTHYQWSVVGSLLTPLPDTEDRKIKAHDDEESEGDILGIDKKIIDRHNMRNVEFDPDGNVQDSTGDDILVQIFGPLSKGVDNADALIFLLIPVVGKYIAIEAMKDYSLQFIYTVFHNARVHLEEEFNKWKNKIKTFVKNLFTPDVSGRYRANPTNMRGISSELDQIERSLHDLASDVQAIEQTLLYDSISGSYAKSRLKLIRLGIHEDARKTKKASSIINNCAARYYNADRSAANNAANIRTLK